MNYVEKRPACEAMQLTAENAAEVAEWTDGFAMSDGRVMFPAGDIGVTASPGDYVMKRPGADPVKVPANEFESRWEPAA